MKNVFKAAIMSIIVAFLFIAILYTIIYVCAGDQIIEAISLINKVAMDNSMDKTGITEIKLSDNNKLEEYPEFGAQYGTMKIESIGVDLPLYYGNTLDILKYGIGQSSAGYFPSQGGSIICMGHNFSSMLASLPKTEPGEEIVIETTYGTFTYVIYDKKIIDETDFDALPVQEEEEILMLYTCYPIGNIGHAGQRYVVYAKLK